MKQFILLLCLSLFIGKLTAQNPMLQKIYNTALLEGRAYDDLKSLCKDIGPRLTGSAEAEMAIRWSKMKMESYDFDTVYLQKIQVPHWERGNRESAWLSLPNGSIIKLNVLALGGSIGTSGLMEGELICFNSLEELRKASKQEIKNKIVFINQAMDASQINTFIAYGGCYPIRNNSASEAAKLGAKAVIIRSLGLSEDNHPHTGSMHYEEGVRQIPAAAVSTADAERIYEHVKKGESVSLSLELDCRSYPDTTSYNVIGELHGKVSPNNIITVGGHLDSWDTGEGAHDDGAGIIHSMEALRILKTNNYTPKNTIRVVFFMNEENGNRGGIEYAKQSKLKNEKHIAALESDRGGFSPKGFSCDGTPSQITLLQSFKTEFLEYDLHVFEKGYGGVDIGPLKDLFPSIPLFGFVPDSQRYFDIHHAPSDVFENVNKRELELGAAAISSLLYLLDQNL